MSKRTLSFYTKDWILLRRKLLNLLVQESVHGEKKYLC